MVFAVGSLVNPFHRPYPALHGQRLLRFKGDEPARALSGGRSRHAAASSKSADNFVFGLQYFYNFVTLLFLPGFAPLS